MKISNLEKMEDIVKNNSDLFWEGWDVCIYLNGDGYYAMDGAFNKNCWSIKKVFKFSDGCWNIPDGYIRNV
jgi:hypothetical protein